MRCQATKRVAVRHPRGFGAMRTPKSAMPDRRITARSDATV